MRSFPQIPGYPTGGESEDPIGGRGIADRHLGVPVAAVGRGCHLAQRQVMDVNTHGSVTVRDPKVEAGNVTSALASPGRMGPAIGRKRRVDPDLPHAEGHGRIAARLVDQRQQCVQGPVEGGRVQYPASLLGRRLRCSGPPGESLVRRGPHLIKTLE